MAAWITNFKILCFLYNIYRLSVDTKNEKQKISFFSRKESIQASDREIISGLAFVWSEAT